MDENLIFDISSLDSALDTLSSYLDLNRNQIAEYIINNKDEYCAEVFLKKFGIKEESILRDKIMLVALHATFNDDDCKAIKDNGLLNLQEALTEDTSLKRFLNKYDIRFDIRKKILFYKDKKIYLESKPSGYLLQSRREKIISNIYRKLYGDYQINAFLHTDNALEYDGFNYMRPEFLQNLACLPGLSDIEIEWEDLHKPYIIKFKSSLVDYEDFTFLDGEEHNLYGKEHKYLLILKSLITKALQAINSIFHYYSKSEFVAYLLKNCKVEPLNIIKIYNEEEYLGELNNF
ncbi:hypothetical protein IGX41_19220 [Bacillus velezensis]|uniref:hypothetical protein n=1 Tax=Bacillus TaxID=1386 RepID=UPI00057F0953|nr:MULTISPECIES: hypothetical protein [Bacillus]AJC24367.1 hypothetical protein SB24_03835 [Bacillus sp. Pc3]MBD8889869.1 hypothetical protein [Bacillus velezensis]MCY7442867.1 hypothetical protein [Bacillus velezensis]PHQ07937.1 hypothetical protein CJ031_03545 [Bacillus velezensis]QTG86328.1 hypothetical protein J4048_06065 [Bacillus amyloliquefaciens]